MFFYHRLLGDYCFVSIPHIRLKFLQFSQASADLSFGMATMFIQKALSTAEILRAWFTQTNKFYLIQSMRVVRTRLVIVGFQILYQPLQCILRLFFWLLSCCLRDWLVMNKLSLAGVRRGFFSRSFRVRRVTR